MAVDLDELDTIASRLYMRGDHHWSRWVRDAVAEIRELRKACLSRHEAEQKEQWSGPLPEPAEPES